MRVLKRIVLLLVLLVAVLAVVGLLLPRHVHVERSLVIEAPRATVFALVSGFRSFNKWSPWFEKDPEAKYVHEGPAAGVGAKLSWAGDPGKVGSGSQEIVESRPFESVTTALDFGSEGKATATFTLAPEGNATKVTWGFDSDLGMNPVGRYFGLLFDRMIGPDYEKGLAGLKSLAEGLPKADFSDLQVEVVQAVPATVACVAASSAQEEKAIGAAIGSAYAQIGRFLQAQRLKQAGPPITINTKWGDGVYEFDAAIPLDRAPDRDLPANSPVKVRQTYGGTALKAVHRGAYRDMPATYERLYAYAAAYGYEAAGPTWDEYASDPGSTPETDLITHIHMPVH